MSAAYLELEGPLPVELDPQFELRAVPWQEDLPVQELDRCAFALQDSRNVGGTWAQQLPTVTWPPLLVVAPQRPSVEHLERARRQGASLVVTVQDLPGLFAHPSGQSLLRSGDWFQASLSTLSTADALQMCSMNQRSGVLTVTCEHASSISSMPWSTGVPQCEGDDRCRGFIGRVVLERGQILHAETPAKRGVDALATMLSVEVGQLRLHEVYVRPAVRTLQGSTAQILIAAAAREDERAQGRIVTQDLMPAPTDPAPTPRPDEGLEDQATDPGVVDPVAPELGEGIEQTVLVDRNGRALDGKGGAGQPLADAGHRCHEALAESCEQLGLGELEGWVRLGEDAFFGCSTGEVLAAGRAEGVKHAFRRMAAFERAAKRGHP
ncbi:MAG: DUF4388 domain-containing protein [Myxococcota bacterium]